MVIEQLETKIEDLKKKIGKATNKRHFGWRPREDFANEGERVGRKVWAAQDR